MRRIYAPNKLIQRKINPRETDPQMTGYVYAYNTYLEYNEVNKLQKGRSWLSASKLIFRDRCDPRGDEVGDDDPDAHEPQRHPEVDAVVPLDHGEDDAA